MFQHDELQPSQESNDTTNFSFSFSLDEDNFFRRACSNCGLHFKIEAEAQDLQDLLAPTFKQIEEEYNIILMSSPDGSKGVDHPSQLGCPYCGHVDEAQNLLTEDFTKYLEQWVYREIIYPHVSSFFEEIEQSFTRRSRPRSRSMFSLEFSFKHDDPGKPIRPISGPELPDMVRISLLCCGQAIKVLEGWGKINCPFCFREMLLM